MWRYFVLVHCISCICMSMYAPCVGGIRTALLWSWDHELCGDAVDAKGVDCKSYRPRIIAFAVVASVNRTERAGGIRRFLSPAENGAHRGILGRRQLSDKLCAYYTSYRCGYVQCVRKIKGFTQSTIPARLSVAIRTNIARTCNSWPYLYATERTTLTTHRPCNCLATTTH